MSIDTLPSSPEPERESAQDGSGGPIVIDGISYIPSSVLLTGIPKISFKDNRSFGVVDSQGECPRLYSPGSELGLYFNDTRYLGIWETTFNGQSGVSLAHDLRFSGNTVVFSMTNRDFPRIDGSGRIARDTFLIRRIMTLWQDALYETLEIKNFDSVPHTIQIEQWSGGRFDDLFEVRGFPREKRGKVLSPQVYEEDGHSTTAFRYEGLDGKLRQTFVHRLFKTELIRMSPTLMGHFNRVVVPPKDTSLIKTIVAFDKPSDFRFHGQHFRDVTVAEKMDALSKHGASSHFAPLSIHTDNAILDRAIQNAQTDIFMLLTEEPQGVLYPYAGIPWFSAPFGRDGLITAYQLLPWAPKLARGVLEYAFQTLGSRFDPFTDEQPGKVFHEMRRGEMANTREVPFIPYYGSVDSTPLALILLYEYVRWTKDLESLRKWWPEALRALEWVRRYGDPNGDGFLEYAKQSPTGLLNQGWKDSNDSVMHADGKLAQAPISLCEVQAYAFHARLGMATLARLLGDYELAARLRTEALELKLRFSERYWEPNGGFVSLALDGDGNPCTVKSSNMGHCLWSQILSPEQARDVSRHLLSDQMFSGYGVRTLSADEVAYNPLSYHNGSIWPHDNSIIMEGLRNYGFSSELERLAIGMIDVLESSDDFRLPELFCGFRKRSNAAPVPYEVACKPQAWAAGSIFLMLKSMLGISMDADQSYVVFNAPLLTPRVNTLEIKSLQGRDWEMDLVFRRSTHRREAIVEITRKSGNVRVLTVK